MAMYNRGLSHGMLLSTADYLLRIIELLDLRDDIAFRKVSIEEVESAGDRWARTIKNHPMKRQVASSHMARRVLVGNLYKEVKDSNLIAKISGHVENSRAFSRYRDIDEERDKEAILKLE